MAVSKVNALWTALIGAFVALFTALGLTAPAAAAPRAAAPAAEPAAPAAGTALPGGNDCSEAERPDTDGRTYAPAGRDGRSLPPTMKQRISAEAHGGVPASRISPDGLTRHAAADTSPAAAE